MRTLRVFIVVLLLCGFISTARSQYFKVDSSFYSVSLKEKRNVTLFLPDTYFQENDVHYPVIYFLHGWGGNHNSLNDRLEWLNYLLGSGMIQPTIIVCADNSDEPFGSGVYVNSSLTGNFEDYNINDLIPWVESKFRAISHKNARGMLGQSLGGFGALRYGILHKDMIRAVASHGAQVNTAIWLPMIGQMLMFENSGPPYFYDFYGFNNDLPFGAAGFFTRSLFLAASGFSPDPNSQQNYINPQIVQFPYNQYAQIIDSIYDKWMDYNITSMVNTLTPADSVGILVGCGLYDETLAYLPNLSLSNALNTQGIAHELYVHKAGHVMPDSYFTHAVIFLDSLLMDPDFYTANERKPLESHFQVYPNPAGKYVHIGFDNPASGKIDVNIYDLKGSLVQQLNAGRFPKGYQTLTLELAGCKPGAYLLNLLMPEISYHSKLIVH